MYRLLVTTLVLLSACGPSARDLCTHAALKDLRAIDILIGEITRDLNRGYGIDHSLQGAVIVSDCTFSDGSSLGGPSGSCAGTVQTVERPRAILPKIERRKLKALEEKRARLVRPTALTIMECRAQYPER